MEERNERVIKAFINVVEKGKKDYDTAVLLIEDTQKYGYLTEADKQIFYTAFEPPVVEVSETINNMNEI